MCAQPTSPCALSESFTATAGGGGAAAGAHLSALLQFFMFGLL